MTEGLVGAVRFVLQGFSPIRATLGEDAMFGDVEDVPVNMISPGSTLPHLHLSLLHAVEELGGKLLYPRWSGINYQPHISRKPDLILKPGDVIVVNSAHLIRSLCEEPKRREIVESFHW
jgi:hypothetical protein